MPESRKGLDSSESETEEAWTWKGERSELNDNMRLSRQGLRLVVVTELNVIRESPWNDVL